MQDSRKYFFPLLFLVLALSFFIVSGVEKKKAAELSSITEKVNKSVTKALDELDGNVQELLGGSILEDLPKDMSIYLYEYDSLIFWRNTLPLINDRLESSLTPQKLVQRHHGRAPIQIRQDGQFHFTTLGSAWYLTRLYTHRKGVQVLAALYICEAKSEGIHRRVSERLDLPGNCYITSIPYDIGLPVKYQERPLFFINSSPQHAHNALDDSPYKWIGLGCLILFFILLLRTQRTFRMWIFTQVALLICYFIFRSWGNQIDTGTIFTPLIYSGGKILSSFGALMGHCTYILLVIISIFIMREVFLTWTCEGNHPRRRIVAFALLIATTLFTGIYFGASLLSYLNNSSVPIYLNQRGPGFAYGMLSTLVFTVLFSSMILLFSILGKLLQRCMGIQRKAPNILHYITLSFLLSLGIHFILTAVETRKEQERAEMWAERLSMERDMLLEMRLKHIEQEIKKDAQTYVQTSADTKNEILRNRILDRHLSRIPRGYLTEVTIYDHEDQISQEKLQNLIEGEAIAPGSHFIWNCDENGILHYNAIFRRENGKLISISIESASGREEKNINHLIMPSETSPTYTPDIYSYGKYIDRRLVSYKGVFPYATYLSERYNDLIDKGRKVLRTDGWIHFFNNSEGGETIIISRKQVGFLPIASSIFQRMMVILIICLLAFYRKPKKTKLNSFTRRITSTVMLGFTLSLACIVFISIRFVIDSNIEDAQKVEFEKISTVQTLLEQECKNISSVNELSKNNFAAKLEDVAVMTSCDINLFTPQGKLFMSTHPQVYIDMRIGSRMDDNAYYNLVYMDRRFHHQERKFEKKRYSVLYTPITNRFGECICLAAVPIQVKFRIMASAIPHATLLIVIAFLLILISRHLVFRFTEKIFEPLNKVGEKMEHSDISGLEHIEYTENDEIATLINAYNRMVDMIQSSAKVMASKERDKAWSEMARQVAHEIKNPLTPIKLDLQRLIRLKAQGKSEWSDRFDELSRIILENIDVLTETANDFSSFAKLYTQEPVEFDLDQTLTDQISLFDNKDHIQISYVGLKETFIHGPKPQLIRVFVNLITNSIQSIENAGLRDGKILVCLRKGQKDGMLEITFEDNGPGVAEENIEKLFTPNFTTKTGGAGIGLAMCRNILQMCDGSIRYSRSFGLNGACFTIELPHR